MPLATVADFAEPVPDDIRECSWWRPLDVACLDDPDARHPLLAELVPELLRAFRAQGHRVHTESRGGVDLMLGLADIPEGPGPLPDRIPERDRPYALTVMREYGLDRRPDNLVVLAAVPERFGDHPHAEVVETARTAMARIGTPKLVLVSGSDAVEEVTSCTLEGGHPTDRERVVERLRDRLVTAACAREVGGDYDVVEDGLSGEVWRRTPVPDVIVEAGRRMDRLHLLPPPRSISEYVSEGLASIYRRFLGLKGFSEGMLFCVDPASGTTMVTASGSWEVDKRSLRREEVVPLDGSSGGRVRVLAPEGVRPKGPSVEAWEVLALLDAVPTVRVAERPDGVWHPEPDGEVEVPLVRAGIHAHVGVRSAAPERVESVPANRSDYPFGFGCGTDLMCGLVRDAAARSSAINDPDDPRAHVRWPMLYHGETVVELWKPGAADTPLAGLLDLFEDGAIDHSPDHLEQPV